MIGKISLFVVLTLLISFVAKAQDYPYNLPSNISASIDIKTASQEQYNNLLLGTNIHGFSTSEEKDLIERYNPITVRFPHGLWSNWYDWRRDVTRLFGAESFVYKQGVNSTPKITEVGMLATIKIFDNGNIKVGIDGLTSLNANKKANTGKGYDMIWTFNMNADGTDFDNGSPETIARYKDLIERGLEVKAIEMGNECFYPGQRSSIIPNAEDYIARAKSMSAALKSEDPNIKVSIPLLRKDSWANPNWNIDLTQDTSYFDAVTVHTYVGADPDDPENGDEAFGTALTARVGLANSINNYARKVAPTKPIWLSEWGVKSGGANAVSALGMADCYIYMSENQNVFERANWFSANGQLNSFLVWHQVDINGTLRPRIKYPLEKTAFGSTYEILRGVFENSTLVESSITSPNLIDGVNAISARVVAQNGKLIVFVVNLTNQEVPFNLNVDDSEYSGSFKHEAMSFSTMGEEKILPIDTEPMNVITEGIGQIVLPKFSINTILLHDATIDIETAIPLRNKPEDAVLKVFPNPIINRLTVSVDGAIMDDVSIYNFNGQLVYNAKPKSEQVQLTAGDLFTSGVYIIEVTTAQARMVQKIIIKK